MRTTINLDEALLDEAQRITGLTERTALTYDLTLVTRNVRDFTATGARLHNPFE